MYRSCTRNVKTSNDEEPSEGLSSERNLENTESHSWITDFICSAGAFSTNNIS